MTPVVSGERATATWLTGAAGLLVLAAAVVMMMVAAPPAPAHPRPHLAAVLTTTQVVTEVTAYTRATGTVSPGIPRR
jgi:hypothetical protein